MEPDLTSSMGAEEEEEDDDEDDDTTDQQNPCEIMPDSISPHVKSEMQNAADGESTGIKKRKSYANSYKLEAVRLAEKIGNRPAAKQMGMEESNIREWRKRKFELEQMPANKRTKRHARPKWLDLETTLAEWFTDRKNRNLYVTTSMVKEKGLELAIQNGYTDFSGSSGWVARFMSRLRENKGDFRKYNFSHSKKNKEAPPVETLIPDIPPELVERSQFFRSFFAEKRAQSELKRRNGIITLDEVPLTLDMPSEPYSSNGPNGDLNQMIPPAEKVQFTVVLSASAAGGKLPPLVIFKGKALPKDAALVFPDGVVIRANDRGWINPNLLEDWIEHCWKKWLWPQRSEDNLLILDSCRTHLNQEMKFKCSKHFQTTFIPKGMGQFLNPLELSVIKSFKENLMKQWEQGLLDQACGSDDRLDESGLPKRVENYMTICLWILEAWKDINPQVIMNGFAKAGIESFTPDEVVEAVLNDNNDIEHPDSSRATNYYQSMSSYPDEENLIGDDFDGWDC